MAKVLDLVGERYGRLVVIAKASERTAAGQSKWVTRCDCGAESVKTGNGLRTGDTRSCGCLWRETPKGPAPGNYKSLCGTNTAYVRGCRCAACTKAHRDKASAYYVSSRMRAADDPPERKIAKARHLKNKKLVEKYGLTLAQFEAVLEAQGNRCGCCHRLEPDAKHGWVVDHCHETGMVRGILCSRCNTRLGAMGDNEVGVREWADRMIRYLKQRIG